LVLDQDHRAPWHRLHDVHPDLEDGGGDLLIIRQSGEEESVGTQVISRLQPQQSERRGGERRQSLLVTNSDHFDEIL
jgi:hypothetical protein